MPPEAITLATFIIQESIKHAPQIKEAILAVLTRENPTAADFDELRRHIAESDYFKFVPRSDIPK